MTLSTVGGSAVSPQSPHAADDVKPHAKVERYTDRYAGTAAGGVLQEAMTLDPAYFPQELYSKKDKRCASFKWNFPSPSEAAAGHVFLQ